MSFRVSATADYALRGVVALAGHTGVCKGPVLAELADIPPNYVDNIMRLLRDAGLVDSRRGQAGGYWLTRSAEDITVAEVVVAVDPPPWEVAATPMARWSNGSPFAPLWRQAFEVTLGELDTLTVADLMSGGAGR